MSILDDLAKLKKDSGQSAYYHLLTEQILKTIKRRDVIKIAAELLRKQGSAKCEPGCFTHDLVLTLLKKYQPPFKDVPSELISLFRSSYPLLEQERTKFAPFLLGFIKTEDKKWLKKFEEKLHAEQKRKHKKIKEKTLNCFNGNL